MFKWLNLSWIPGCICNLVTAAIDVYYGTFVVVWLHGVHVTLKAMN